MQRSIWLALLRILYIIGSKSVQHDLLLATFRLNKSL